jgi:hypothetical protein
MTRDPSCAPRTFGGWTCPDCGALNERDDASCEACAEAERVGPVNIEVKMPDGSEIVVEDFIGTVAEAKQMVERHYPNAASAVIRIED